MEPLKVLQKNIIKYLILQGIIKKSMEIIPIFMILMTGKNEYLYNMVFHDVKSFLKDIGIKLDSIPKRFMIDFKEDY